MATFGGTVRFSYAGTPLIMRGHITIGPSNMKAESVPNQDGSISRTMAVKGYTAKCKFEDSTNGAATPQPWDAIIKAGPYNFTVVEDMTGVTHMWTAANFIGDVEVDREKGEVTGLSIVANGYQAANF